MTPIIIYYIFREIHVHVYARYHKISISNYYCLFCSSFYMQSIQKVYDDTATVSVSRKHEVIQTVMNDVKTHQATIETNLADMLDARYKSGPNDNINRSA